MMRSELEETQRKLKRLQERKAILDKHLERASIGSRGEIQNSLDLVELDIVECLQKLHDNAGSEITPNDVNINIYIIVTNKKNVETTLGDAIFAELEADRYDNNDLHKWKPFHKEADIEKILEELRVDYIFTPKYIDADTNSIHSVFIEDNQPDCIGVIDVLSINESNRDLAKCFDNNNVAGTILPECRQILKHDMLYTYYIDKRNQIFSKQYSRVSNQVECSNFCYNISEVDNLKTQIIKALKQKPITNKAVEYSKMRDLNW
jgi:hypothetical protein